MAKSRDTVGSVYDTNDNYLDKNAPKKKRSVVVLAASKKKDVAVAKVYSNNNPGNRYKISKNAKFSKDSYVGKDVITHDKDNKQINLTSDKLRRNKRNYISEEEMKLILNHINSNKKQSRKLARFLEKIKKESK